MKKIYILMFAMLAFVSTATAQTLKSVFFTENNTQRHTINPAIASEKGYFTIPFVGNVSGGVNSNLKLSSLLYPTDGGKLNTLLSPAVSAENISNIDEITRVNGNLSFDILSFGSRNGKKFNTFAISTHVNVDATIPREFFAFMKNGMQSLGGNTYDLKNFGLSASAITEIAYGHSNEYILPGLRIGGKVKVLLGVANVNLEYDKFDVNLRDDQWSIHSQGNIYASGLALTYDEEGRIDGVGSFNPSINGFGVGVDIGATYTLFDRLELSLSIMDFGFMTWNNISQATTKGDPVPFNGFDEVDIFNPDGYSFDDQLSDFGDSAVDALLGFYEYQTGKSSRTEFKPTVNVGGRFELTEQVDVGVLLTSQFADLYTWTDIMGSVNLKPLSWLNIGVNGSLSNLGNTYGALIDISISGLNFFVGANVTSLKYSSGEISLPINGSTLQTSLGINLLLPHR